MLSTVAVALHVAEEVIEEAISKAETYSDSLVRIFFLFNKKSILSGVYFCSNSKGSKFTSQYYYSLFYSIISLYSFSFLIILHFIISVIHSYAISLLLFFIITAAIFNFLYFFSKVATSKNRQHIPHSIRQEAYKYQD